MASGSNNPGLPTWNMNLAGQYLDERAKTWFAFSGAERGVGSDKISCISCHSLLPYALARPALRKLTGQTQPTEWETRVMAQITKRVEHWHELDSDKYRLFYDFSEQKKKESWGTEAILNCLLLALEDQAQGRKEPSATTRKGFVNLWQTQESEGSHTGSWEWLDFGLDPWETKEARYFGATLAAIAVGTAPGYYTPQGDGNLDKKVALLRDYLGGQLVKQKLNNRIWMLWASAKLDGLLPKEEQNNLSQEIFQKQQLQRRLEPAFLGTSESKRVRIFRPTAMPRVGPSRSSNCQHDQERCQACKGADVAPISSRKRRPANGVPIR